MQRETDDAVTLFITPGFRWRGHRAGQYLRIGFDIQGKRHWRAYSLSSDAARPDGQITITVKRTVEGVVSQFLHGPQAVGSIVTLGEVEGQFTLPDASAAKLLFLTAGSGITPVMAMLRALDRRCGLEDIVHLHSARRPGEAIFAPELEVLAGRHSGYVVTQRLTSEAGRVHPEHLDALCSDWRERETYACGPGEMLAALATHFTEAGVGERLHIESFEHVVPAAVTGRGGEIEFSTAGLRVACDGATPILLAGEAAEMDLPFGCRMGICHTCVGSSRTARSATCGRGAHPAPGPRSEPASTVLTDPSRSSSRRPEMSRPDDRESPRGAHR